MDKLKKLAWSAIKVGQSLGVQAYRKSKKPFRHYMAPERAENVLEEQKAIPKRAPMNVPKMEFSKEKVATDKVAVSEMLKRSDELLKNLKHVKVVSHDPTGSQDSPEPSGDESSTKRKPQQRILKKNQLTDPPRGLIALGDLVELLHNYETADWTAAELAEAFRLRENEVEDIVKYFSLVKPKDKLLIAES